MQRTLTIALLAGACTHPIHEPIAARGGTTEVKREPHVVLDYMRMAIEARDAHALAALYADDAVLEFAGTRTVRGKAAIEAAMREAFAPAESIRIGFPRLWLKGDVAIAEAVFHATHPASSGIHDVGESEVVVLAFDAGGRIAHEQIYANQMTLDMQADGDPDAEPIPAIPTTTEVHVAAPGANDAAVIAWANAAEATFSHDEVDASLIDEHAAWDCSLGFHGTNRAQLEQAYVKWQQAFPNETLTATQVWPVEDYVIVEETFTGVFAGELFDIPATHREVTWKWLKIWRVDHGKIMRGWQWGDWKELEAQITAPSHPKHKPACSIES